ncbi:hypothetical protein Ciccas_004307 [Cichlidogyrus casuarinus]|uniref:Uncharacterized protein n=1 Tax=Cichlidogyrus casuarinus TaxID=1844966 RepID=A0ABD2QBX9_9PLAT
MQQLHELHTEHRSQTNAYTPTYTALFNSLELFIIQSNIPSSVKILHYHLDEQISNVSAMEVLDRHCIRAESSGQHRPNHKYGFDVLSAELMRAKGLGGGFHQLKRAKDFKTAKGQPISPNQTGKSSITSRKQQNSVDSTTGGSIGTAQSGMLHSDQPGQNPTASVRRARLTTANSIAVGCLGNRGSDVDVHSPSGSASAPRRSTGSFLFLIKLLSRDISSDKPVRFSPHGAE